MAEKRGARGGSADMPRAHSLFEQYDNYLDDRERLTWQGTFEEYLDKVVDNPDVSKTSHQIVYEALTANGNYFESGKNALYGSDAATERFVEVLKAGAEGLEIGKRIIMLVGPPGSGKSTLVNGTKRAIEAYSRTDEGALYAISGCPMHEDPMHLMPKSMRPMLEEDFNITIDGDLCPHCAATYGDLGTEALKEVPVERFVLSEKDRVGVGVFKPSDPKSQDITELVGSVDFSKIGEFGTASDPRAYRFDGELNIANRGVMEFVEMLKSDEKFLYSLLDLAQDRVIKAPRFPNTSADEVILAHTNLAEYYRYVADPKNEAIRDRLVIIPVPYTLEVSAERKIHEKLIGESKQVRESGVHINPHALTAAATFGVLSRIKSAGKYSKVDKMKIYDGKSTANLSPRDIREIKSEFPDEGMTGISPRYIIDSLSMALTRHGSDKACLTPIDTIRALRDNLDNHAHTRDMKKEEKDALLDDIDAVKKEYDETAKNEVQSAFVYAFEDTARTLCDNYLANVEAFCEKRKIVDPITDEETAPDEKLMRSIEEQIGVSENGKKEFRNELLIRMGATLRRGETFDHTTHARLGEAIEKKLFADMKDMVKLTTSARVPNKEQQERIAGVEKTLVEEKGYCPHCASELVRYVGTLLSKA
jgi:serine protein kinase